MGRIFVFVVKEVTGSEFSFSLDAPYQNCESFKI